jgi:hypothetical protein
MKFRRSIWWIAVLILAVVVSIPVISFIDVSIVREQLKSSILRWQTHNILDYELTFDLGIPLAMLSTRFVFTIHNGTIVETKYKALFDLRDPTYDPNKVEFTSMDVNSPTWLYHIQLDDYSIAGRFKWAKMDVDDGSRGYDYSFNPQYGYIETVKEICDGSIGDCGFRYQVVNFIRLSSN